MIKKFNIEAQEKGTDNLVFIEEFMPGTKFDMFLWLALVDKHFLIAKYIYNTEDRDSDNINKEIVKAKKALETLVFLEEEYREQALASYQFDKFMFSLVSSRTLTSLAYKNNNPIELVVLLANQIDAGLRLAILLHQQIETKSQYIDIKLIQQKEDDRVVMEKTIYKTALEKGIIDEQLNSELIFLYNQRNKVIHRYIISDITTKEVKEISINYSLMEQKVSEVVVGLEKKQFEEKVGFYGKKPADTPLTREQEVFLQNGINEKHADFSFINPQE